MSTIIYDLDNQNKATIRAEQVNQYVDLPPITLGGETFSVRIGKWNGRFVFRVSHDTYEVISIDFIRKIMLAEFVFTNGQLRIYPEWLTYDILLQLVEMGAWNHTDYFLIGNV